VVAMVVVARAVARAVAETVEARVAEAMEAAMAVVVRAVVKALARRARRGEPTELCKPRQYFAKPLDGQSPLCGLQRLGYRGDHRRRRASCWRRADDGTKLCADVARGPYIMRCKAVHDSCAVPVAASDHVGRRPPARDISEPWRRGARAADVQRLTGRASLCRGAGRGRPS